ncbi:hypothetical protein [Gemmobacter denitrificans]|uniref:DUF3563 domain-containing protein n=1 Tax=Gemmobacter denitrificans TaxID=3123040 RepID=A0ABU8BXM6_9RHOB
MLHNIQRLISGFRSPSIDEQERAYLESARDRVDLEYRQHEIDMGKFRRNFVYYY